MSGRVIVSQLGARMHYAVPRILHEAGRLERLYTDICAVKGWPRGLSALPPTLLPSALRRLRGRVPHDIPADKIFCFQGVGVTAVTQRMMMPGRAADTRVTLNAARAFSRSVVRSGFGDADGFYGMSGECLEQMQAARLQGLWTAVEQVVAPRDILDRLVAAEAERHPDWAAAHEADPLASDYAAREKAEWGSADLVVCPSEFVREGIAEAGGPVERCAVVPYGIDMRFRLPAQPVRKKGRLRVLTVGIAGLRKGTPYVAEAAQRLPSMAEFRVVGPIHSVPPRLFGFLREVLTLWGPTPRSEIAQHYAWADVFLLPSVCEGSATVIYEALAAGLPVITTPNSGSVVRDGIDGFVCPAGNVDAICDRVALLAQDRDLLEWMASQAREAAGHYDLAAYGSRLLAALAALEAERPRKLAATA